MIWNTSLAADRDGPEAVLVDRAGKGRLDLSGRASVARSQSCGRSPEQRVAQRATDDVGREALGVERLDELADRRRNVEPLGGQLRPRNRYVRQASLRWSARYGVNRERRLLPVHAVPRRPSERGLADIPVPGTQLTAERLDVPAPVREPRRGAPRPGLRGIRRRWLAPRHDARAHGARLGPRDRRTPGADPGDLPRLVLREPLRDRHGPPR